MLMLSRNKRERARWRRRRSTDHSLWMTCTVVLFLLFVLACLAGGLVLYLHVTFGGGRP